MSGLLFANLQSRLALSEISGRSFKPLILTLSSLNPDQWPILGERKWVYVLFVGISRFFDYSGS